MINAANIKEYINYLHLKKYSAPATEELRNRWAAVPEAELSAQLQGLYQHWGIDRATAGLYEQMFLQSQYLYSNNPAQQETYIPQQPSVQQPQPSSYPAPQANPGKRNTTALIIGIFIALIVVGTAGAVYFLITNDGHSTANTTTDTTAVKQPATTAPIEQNATEPEPVTVAAANDASADDEINTEAIKALLGAEEDRNMSAILSSFSPQMEQYWDLSNPTQEELVKRYNSVWTKSGSGKHTNIRIEKTGDRSYDMFADYEFFSVKEQINKSIKAHVRYIFDTNNKIIRTFEVK